MHRSLYFAIFLFSTTLLLALLLRSGQLTAVAQQDHWQEKRQLVQQLGLTDLAIWSEARYTRHPSQADLFSAFQDNPGAFDHFPAGSIVPPVTPQIGTRLEFKKKGQQ